MSARESPRSSIGNGLGIGLQNLSTVIKCDLYKKWRHISVVCLRNWTCIDCQNREKYDQDGLQFDDDILQQAKQENSSFENEDDISQQSARLMDNNLHFATTNNSDVSALSDTR